MGHTKGHEAFDEDCRAVFLQGQREAIATLRKMLKSPNESMSIRAAIALLNAGFRAAELFHFDERLAWVEERFARVEQTLLNNLPETVGDVYPPAPLEDVEPTAVLIPIEAAVVPTAAAAGLRDSKAG